MVSHVAPKAGPDGHRARSRPLERGGAPLVTVRPSFICAAYLMAVGPSSAGDIIVTYEGAPEEIASKIENLTSLSGKEREFPTAASLRRAATADIEIIRRSLVAAGFFNSSVSYQINGPQLLEGTQSIVFRIEPGQRFQIDRHILHYKDAEQPGRPSTFAEAAIPVDNRADGATLESNQRRLQEYLLSHGFPRTRIISRRAEARLSEGFADAVYEFESGPRTAFNGIEVKGAKHTRQDFIASMKTWENGAYFDRNALVEFRDELSKSGLFTSIEVDAGETDAAGNAPVIVTVEERKLRTIGAGVSFSTSEGPGGRLFLEYRNIAGRGERARAELRGSEIQQAFDFRLSKPMPRLRGSIFSNLSIVNDTTDAFNARSIELGAGLVKHWLDDRLETKAGVTIETSDVESRLRIAPDIDDERIYLLSTPLSVTWDTEDDPLKLTSGARVSLSLSPHVGTDQFTRLEVVGRTRSQFGTGDRFAIAGRVRIAATAGSGLRSLPVNKRLFAGGGSSVRGYNFQSVGPLDPDGAPIGGRSVVEAALEGRAKVLGRFQIAAFADAGAVYSESFPDFVGDYLVGAGGGLRYLSPIGPVRLDVAFPLEKRSTDSDFQFYISLGQPF